MTHLSTVPVPLGRDVYMRRLLRELSGVLEDVIGLAEASGYVSVVGAAMAEEIDRDYRQALALERLDRDQVRDVLVDLKRRIEGQFYVLEETEDRIVFGNAACPFGRMVLGRPSLCMMTSTMFGFIAAENLGWAAVEIEEAIARGHAGCRVVVHLRPGGPARPAAREYFRREAA